MVNSLTAEDQFSYHEEDDGIKRTAVILEDDKTTQLMITKMLKSLNIQSYATDDLEMLLKVIDNYCNSTSRKLYVFLDNQYKQGGLIFGVNVCRVLSYNKQLHIIGMSTNNAAEQFMENGAKFFISKPFNQEQLEAVLPAIHFKTPSTVSLKIKSPFLKQNVLTNQKIQKD